MAAEAEWAARGLEARGWAEIGREEALQVRGAAFPVAGAAGVALQEGLAGPAAAKAALQEDLAESAADRVDLQVD